ncbi:MAG: hypothetical protein C0618_11130 [Desulfuromonas sp.]|nr:MAG: hypothetical protein C0618_11130 [Desulfuromonas sp.]
MLEEYGTVVELKGKQVAVVLCQRHSACEHCASSGACQIGSDGKTMLVDAFNVVGAETGDRVKIATSTQHFLKSSFLLYIVPIIALLIGAIGGQTLAESYSLGMTPVLFSALMGVSFLLGSFVLLRLATRSLNRETYMPRIVKVESPSKERSEDIQHGN